MSEILPIDRPGAAELEIVDLAELKTRAGVTGSSEDEALRRVQKVAAELLAGPEGIARVWWRGQIEEVVEIFATAPILWLLSHPVESVVSVSKSDEELDITELAIIEGGGLRRGDEAWHPGRYTVNLWAGWATPVPTSPEGSVEMPQNLTEIALDLCVRIYRRDYVGKAGVKSLSDVTGKTEYGEGADHAITPAMSRQLERYRR